MSDTPKTLSEAAANWNNHLAESNAELERIQREIDDITYELYGIGEEDRKAIEAMLGQGAAAKSEATEEEEGAEEEDEGEEEEAGPSADPRTLVSEFLDYCVGCAFGRWDIRCATGEKPEPPEPDPFDPLPVCAPGMLQNSAGLPAEEKDVPTGYPLRITWPGILVDDEGHQEDVVARVREAIAVMWGERAEAIEQEACEMLGVASLRDYFQKPALFFAEHLRRHSKSRRQAPLYWPIGIAKGRYTLWLYYHRLDNDTLYKCLQQFVEPELADIEKELSHLRGQVDATMSTRERKRQGALEELRRELNELRTVLEHWAPQWKPALNDGVLITAAPLHKLFRLPKWQKDLAACWKKLEKGDFDWAHLAHSLWPARVREKCRHDRSMAIAHGLEELCEVKAPVKKEKKAKATKAAKKRNNQDPTAQQLEM
jgi:hypothetical protein